MLRTLLMIFGVCFVSSVLGGATENILYAPEPGKPFLDYKLVCNENAKKGTWMKYGFDGDMIVPGTYTGERVTGQLHRHFDKGFYDIVSEVDLLPVQVKEERLLELMGPAKKINRAPKSPEMKYFAYEWKVIREKEVFMGLLKAEEELYIRILMVRGCITHSMVGVEKVAYGRANQIQLVEKKKGGVD